MNIRSSKGPHGCPAFLRYSLFRSKTKTNFLTFCKNLTKSFEDIQASCHATISVSEPKPTLCEKCPSMEFFLFCISSGKQTGLSHFYMIPSETKIFIPVIFIFSRKRWLQMGITRMNVLVQVVFHAFIRSSIILYDLEHYILF